MKQYKKLHIAITALVLGGFAITPFATLAQKFAVKPYADIGVGGAMNLKSEIPLASKSSTATAFGIDFGYTFWKKGGNSLEANIGLGYTVASLKLGAEDFSYSYNAPYSADVDGNSYIRHCSVEGLEQKLNLGYFNIPLYLSYRYQFSNRIGVHADLGFRFGFKCSAKLNSVNGTVTSYGVYPEYDNLMIDIPGLNGFGQSELSEAKRGNVDANGFYSSLLVGAGLDVYLGGPAWLNVGLRYDCGFSNSFKKLFEGGSYTAESAPVTYTVAEGQEVKPLTGYLSSSKLSPLSIHAGFTFKF